MIKPDGNTHSTSERQADTVMEGGNEYLCLSFRDWSVYPSKNTHVLSRGETEGESILLTSVLNRVHNYTHPWKIASGCDGICLYVSKCIDP